MADTFMKHTKTQHLQRTVILPFEQGTGLQIKEALGIAPERILLVKDETGKHEVGPNEVVKVREDICFSDAPVHKAGMDPIVGQRLAAEAAYLGQEYSANVTRGYDAALRRWWVHVPKLPLPFGWNERETAILVTVTDEYPIAGPDGFMLNANLHDRHGRKPDHYFETVHLAKQFSDAGWAWYCIHPVGWRGDHDFRDGDSVAKYLDLIEIKLKQACR
jgi:hypothetical protein